MSEPTNYWATCIYQVFNTKSLAETTKLLLSYRIADKKKKFLSAHHELLTWMRQTHFRSKARLDMMSMEAYV